LILSGDFLVADAGEVVIAGDLLVAGDLGGGEPSFCLLPRRGGEGSVTAVLGLLAALAVTATTGEDAATGEDTVVASALRFVAAGAPDFLPPDFEPAAPVAAPTAADDLRVFAITIMTTLDRDEVGKGMISVSEALMGYGGIMMQFAKKWKS
jgi:hypothetical protein